MAITRDSNLAEKDVVTSPAATSPISQSPTQRSFQSNLDRFRHVQDADQDPKSILTASTSDSPNNSSTSRKRHLSDVLNSTTSQPRSAASSPAKKRRESSRYADPSRYAHLSKLTDIIEPNLIGIFVGFNPGVATATAGHAYAHPSNHFWKLVHSSGLSDVRLRPEQDVNLPRLYQMGNTNLVERPSKDLGELSKKEMAAGTPILEEKIRAFKPESICIVGKGIWDAIWRWRHGREIRKDEFHYGWQAAKERMGRIDGWEGAWVFVATATSGLAASLKPPQKEAIWKPYGDWVKTRRIERAIEAEEATQNEETKDLVTPAKETED